MTPTDPAEAIEQLVVRMAQPSATNINEAATRLELVNRILEAVLGWNIAEFHPEEYAGSDGAGPGKRIYLDYHLRSKSNIKLVVEAKRAGKTFVLDAHKRPRLVSLQALENNHGRVLSEVVRQAKRYCQKVGTPGFVVTNGHQWIASLAFAQNIPESSFQAVVWYSLEDIRDNLREFIDLLSPLGVANQSLMKKAVAGPVFTPSFAGSLNGALSHASPQVKNYLTRELASLMKVCFGDLTDHDHAEMLDACYVASDTADFDTKRLETFAGQMVPQGLPVSRAHMGRTSGSEDAFTDAAGTEGESILVVGRAGSGKSTFLAVANRRLTQRANASGSKHLILHVDLKTRTETHAERFDHDQLIEDICESLLDAAETVRPDLNPYRHDLLKEIFARELGRLKASLSETATAASDFNDRIDATIQKHLERKLAHLKAYLGYLARQQVRAVVLLDNVDRGTEAFERVTYQLAQTLAQNTRAVVVTSLRDTTYLHGKAGGFLDVGRHTVFTISPPPFVEVARRRFGYVREQLRDDEKLGRRLRTAFSDTSSSAVFDFADIIAEAVLDDGDSVGRCLQALAGTNIRRALELLEDFTTSPHTDIERIFKRQQGNDVARQRSGLSLDDFLRSTMRGQLIRYEEGSSKILNLFQVPRTSVFSHFTAVRILQYLGGRLGTGESPSVRLEELALELGSLGHRTEEVRAVINRLGRFGLVNSLSTPEPPWTDADSVSLGVAGRYYLDDLIWNREYLQNIIDDTILYEEPVFDAIKSIHENKAVSWPKRYDEKMYSFLLYLARHEHAELQSFAANESARHWLAPVAEEMGRRHFGTNFKAAAARARRRPSDPPPRAR